MIKIVPKPYLLPLITILSAFIFTIKVSAQPVISSISPSTGRPGTSVTITGSGFSTTATNNVIYFGTTRASVTSASASSLTVTLDTGAIFGPVSEWNTATGLSCFSKNFFTPTFTNSYFINDSINLKPRFQLTGVNRPIIAALGDVDGDGKTDIIVDNRDSARIGVYRNISSVGSLSSASFESPVYYSTGPLPTNVKLADMDGDGKLDIMVTNTGSNSICLFYNECTPGTVSFAPRVTFTQTDHGLAPQLLAIEDYDGDGKPDIAVTNRDTATLTIFRNVSTSGSFTTSSLSAPFSIRAGRNNIGLSTADLDGDGKPDLVSIDTLLRTVSVFRNTAVAGVLDTNSFEARDTFSTGASPVDVQIGDIDGDGKLDILFTNLYSNSFSVMRNTSTTGTLSFEARVNFGTPDNPVSLSIADMNGDGKPDVITANAATTANNISVYRNTSTTGSISASSFAARVNRPCGSGPYAVSTGDLDGDHYPDIVTANNFGNAIGIIRNYPLPYVAPISGPSVVCYSGGPYTYTDTVSGGYWSVSNTTIATITSGGVLHTVAGGIDTITYMVVAGGDTNSQRFIVTIDGSHVISSITGASGVCLSGTTAAAGTPAGGTWASANPGIASINPASGLISGISSGSTTIRYIFSNSCGTDTSTTGISVTTPPSAGTISGAGAGTICAGGSTLPLFASVASGTWSSSNTARATVTSDGVVTGVSAGSVNISYTVTNGCGSNSAVAALTVQNAPVSGIVGGATGVCQSGTAIVTTTGTGGTWSSGNTSIVTVTSSGTLHGVSGGTAIISYTVTNSCGSATDTSLITVSPLPDTGDITGASALCHGSGPVSLSNSVSGGTWSSTNTSVATVTTTGIVTGVSPGTTIISYTLTNSCGTIAATHPFSVDVAPDAGSVTGTLSVCEASNTALTSTVTGGTWTSGSVGIATIGSSTGLAGGVSTGVSIITYTFTNACGTDTDTALLTVRPLPNAGTISGTTTLCAGTTTTLTDTAGGGTGTWTSTNTGVATVTTSGLVSAVAAGTTIIYYAITNSCGTDSTSVTFTVNPLPVAGSIAGTPHVCVGDTTLLTNATTGGTWATGNATIASTTGGTTVGISAGTAIISYSITNSCGTATDTMLVTVRPLPDAGTITAIDNTLCGGDTTTVYSTNTGGTWSSVTSSVASISAAGIVTAAGITTAGSTVIRYTIGSATCGTDTSVLTINVNPQPNAGSVSGATSVCSGSTTTLTTSGTSGSWISSASGIASVSTSGVVTGGSAGTATISYIAATATCGSDTATRSITVNALPDAGTISAASSTTICGGDSVQLSSTVSGGTWTAIPTTTATVNTTTGLVTGRLVTTTLTATIRYIATTATCGNDTATISVTVNPSPRAGIITSSTSSFVCVGTTINLSTTGLSGTWSSSNTSIATVTSTGTTGGASTGIATITYLVSTATCGADTAIYGVTVNSLPDAGTITATPSATICAGNTTTLSSSVSGGVWSSLSSSIASVNASTGVVTGGAVASSSTATIRYIVSTASCGADTSTLVITVNPLPASGTISGASVVCAGNTITLTSTGTGGTWTSSNTAVATVSGGTTGGVAAGLAIISYSVTNSCGTATDTMMVRVNPQPFAGTIGGTPTVCVGATTILTNSATGGSWTSGTTSVATVSGGTVHGAAIGTTIITYSVTNSCGTAIDTMLVTVNPLPFAGVVSGTPIVCVGMTTPLSTTGTSGSWSSSTTSVAFVNSSGVVTGNAAGTAIISYTATNSCGTARDTILVTVNPLPFAGGITGSFTICQGSTTTLTDTAIGGTWSSGAPTIATVNSAGVVTGLLGGTANITYTVSNSCGTAGVLAPMTILPLPDSGSITGTVIVCPGGTTALSNAITGGIWSSSNTAIATITPDGVVTGNTAGSVTISYAVTNGCGTTRARRTLTVNPLPDAGTITGADSVCAGTTTALSAAATGGLWSSADIAIATVSSTGSVGGASVGTTTVYYIFTNSCGSDTATHIITIKPQPNAGAVSGTTSICAGATTSLSSTVVGGTWISGATAIATVSAAGLVSGVSAGTASISYTFVNSCGTARTITPVTVFPLPVAGTITGSSTVCLGANTALTDTATGGVWSTTTGRAVISGTGVVTGFAIGADTIKYTVTNGCGIAVAIHPISVLPLADTGSVTGPSSMCVNNVVTLTASASGGTWSSSNTAVATVAGGIVYGVSAGVTVISYSATNICGTLSATHLMAVRPVPLLTSALSHNICDNTPFSYTPSSSVAGSVFVWSRSTVVGISNPAASDTGSIFELLSNSTYLPIEVIYHFDIIAGGCANSRNISVIVNPAPSFQGVLADTVCSSSPFYYYALSATPGASFTWVRSAVAGISPASSSGFGSLTETLVNGTLNAITVPYVYTTSAGGCTRTDTVRLTVDPQPDRPVIATAPPSEVCNNTLYWNYGAATPPPPGVEYTWSTSTGGTVWATGGTGQYCLINFTGFGQQYVYLTASIPGYNCTSTNIRGAMVTVHTAAQRDVVFFNKEFICLHNDEDTYQWGYDDLYTLDSTIVTGQTNQNYYNDMADFAHHAYWVMTSKNGCLRKSYFNAPTGVLPVYEGAAVMKVFPNPNHGTFSMNLPITGVRTAQVVITNMMGQKVHEFAADTNIDVPVMLDVPAGIYFISATAGGLHYTAKVTIAQ